jgi:hypothetical protein
MLMIPQANGKAALETGPGFQGLPGRARRRVEV